MQRTIRGHSCRPNVPQQGSWVPFAWLNRGAQLFIGRRRANSVQGSCVCFLIRDGMDAVPFERYAIRKPMNEGHLARVSFCSAARSSKTFGLATWGPTDRVGFTQAVHGIVLDLGYLQLTTYALTIQSNLNSHGPIFLVALALRTPVWQVVYDGHNWFRSIPNFGPILGHHRIYFGQCLNS